MTTLTARQAVEEMMGNTHGILDWSQAEPFWKAFGLEGKPWMQQIACRPNDFKGASLYDEQGNLLPEGTVREAIGIRELAEQICTKLGLQYEHYMGRGFQTRRCCDALARYLDELEKEKEVS